MCIIALEVKIKSIVLGLLDLLTIVEAKIVSFLVLLIDLLLIRLEFLL